MRKQICIYCQTANADTRDHVPPKSLFPQPYPDNLITVPACKACNESTQEDDEDFRTYIAAISTHETGPIIEGLCKATMRAFEHSRAYHAEWVGRRMRVIAELETESGHAIQKLQVWREPNRLGPVIFRSVKGLHYHKFKSLLPVDCPMDMIDSGLQHSDLQPGTELGETLRSTLTELDQSEPIIDYPKIFNCRRSTVDGNEAAAVWKLTFLQRHWFLVFVNLIEPEPCKS